MADDAREEEEEEKMIKMEGVASIALLPNGSISGHFIHLPHSICYGLHGTELECERECSKGEDYRLVKLTITDFNTKKEQTTVVECKGHDAARFHNIDHAHGWDKEITAEDHIRQFMPKLTGMDAVVNIGKMTIFGLDFGAEDEETE
ncbi:unnamed protein product [Vicia faba]|uniref:Uncharacterized protein n=1 Tax=Vicia faba TaxID=3906 RepID=A0AAV0Z9J8_VICFA|nr:unnamed protein product [Vicia faba]